MLVSPKTLKVVTACVLGFLLAVYFVFPILIKHYLNNSVLIDRGKYSGAVESVSLEISQAAYVLRNIEMHNKNKRGDLPFFKARSLAISFSLEALRHGQWLTEARLNHAELNFIDAKSESERQAGLGTDWLLVLEEIVPAALHKIEVSNSVIRFQRNDSKPKINIAAKNIEGIATNLTNVLNLSRPDSASAQVSATLFDQGEYKASARFDPENYLTFTFSSAVEKLSAIRLNDLLRVYLNLDFEKGMADIYLDLESENGELSGNVKPLLKDLRIASWKEDVEEQGNNPIQLMWESSVALFYELLTTLGSDELATEVEISGSLSKADFDSWDAFRGIIKNAFIDSLKSGFKGPVVIE